MLGLPVALPGWGGPGAKGCRRSIACLGNRSIAPKGGATISRRGLGTAVVVSGGTAFAGAGSAQIEGSRLKDAPGVGFLETSLSVNGQEIPVSAWFPVELNDKAAASPAASYPYTISVSKIARVLLKLQPPTWLDRKVLLEAAPGVVAADGRTLPTGNPAVVLAHGYLGSRYDLVDYAEGLASRGFVVVAPEFAESLSDPATMPGESVGRDAIVDATIELCDSIQAAGVAFVGHSAGAGTAVQYVGRRGVARVALAGFRGVPDEVLEEPLLVVASDGDGVINMLPRADGLFGPSLGILGSVDNLPADYVRGRVAVTVARFDAYSSSEICSTSSSPPKRAFLRLEKPNHISFLSARTNDVMIDVLGPLLPVARLLKLGVLDFDRYVVSRDSDETAKVVVPIVMDWVARSIGEPTQK